MSAALNVLVVGCGSIAGGYDAERPDDGRPLTHAGAYRAHGGFRMLTCVDPDDDRRSRFMSRWGVQEGLPSIDAVVGRTGEYDVVSICSPTSSHAADVQAAAALRPKLIFCEKPITPSYEESAALMEACATAGILVAVNHTRRWAPDIVRLRSELAAGAWGKVRSISGIYSKGVLNNGSHMVDLLNYLIGPCEPVYAGQPEADFWEDDPTIPAMLWSEDGVPISLSVGHAADYSLFELQMVTAEGVITMESGGMKWRVRHAIDSPHFKGYKALDDGQPHAGEYELAMIAAARNIHDAVTQGATLASSGATALAAQHTCHRIRQMAAARAEGI